MKVLLMISYKTDSALLSDVDTRASNQDLNGVKGGSGPAPFLTIAQG